MLFEEHRLQVEKKWSELFSIMTEDDKCHVRPSEESEMNGMYVEEFFIKLLVMQERIQKKIENGKTNP